MPWLRPVRPLVLGVVTALLLLVTAVPGHAADTVSGGRLDWGVKKSFVTYITGPIANGEWELVDGAATVGSGGFRFHSASGNYDPGSGDYQASYAGGVHFLGHRKDDGSHELDLTIGNPSVKIGGGKGTLYVDIVTPQGTSRGVAFGDLALSGVDTSGATGSVSIANVPVKLTAEGAKSFEGYYSAGQEMDPLSLTGDLGKSDEPSESPSKSKAKKGEFTGAIVDWGVRRTYREYVTGDIAEGEWELADGAQDGGALFRFTQGEGSHTKRKLAATFDGSIHFSGNDLDLRLSKLAVSVSGDKGKLSATVASGGDTDKGVVLVTFTADSLKPTDGLLLFDQVPTTLTTEGAKAFGDLYPKGTDMDPITVAVPLDDDAQVPPLPDIGADPSASATAKADKASQNSESTSYLWIVIVVIAVLVALTVWALVLRLRGNRDTDAAEPETADAPEADKPPADTEPGKS